MVKCNEKDIRECDMSSITQSKKYSVALIGLGNAGYGRYLSKKEGQVLDHYSAIRNEKSLDLVICVDKQRVSELSEPYAVDVGLLSSLNVDLLVIASTTESHLHLIESFLEHNSARMLLIEKPGTGSLKEILELKSILSKYPETQTWLNYHRNYNMNFFKMLSDRLLGNLQCGTVHYSNGALNNASHALALLSQIIKFSSNVKVIGKSGKAKVADYDFVLQSTEGKNIAFLATNEDVFSNFRIELDFEYGVVFYDSAKGEIQTRMRTEDLDFKNRYNLEPNGRIVQTNEQKSFEFVYNFLVAKLEEKQVDHALGIDLNSAIEIHKIFESIKID